MDSTHYRRGKVIRDTRRECDCVAQFPPQYTTIASESQA